MLEVFVLRFDFLLIFLMSQTEQKVQVEQLKELLELQELWPKQNWWVYFLDLVMLFV